MATVKQSAKGIKTRQAVLAAAQAAFAETGYEGTGLRLIAARAGVNLALINRYFGSKEGLFAAAIVPTLRMNMLLDGPMDNFGERAAAIMMMKSQRHYDPMMAMLGALGSPTCTPLLRDVVDKQLIGPLAARLVGDDAVIRAGLIVAQLTGFDMVLRAVGSMEMREAERAHVMAQLAGSLQRLVDGEAIPSSHSKDGAVARY